MENKFLKNRDHIIGHILSGTVLITMLVLVYFFTKNDYILIMIAAIFVIYLSVCTILRRMIFTIVIVTRTEIRLVYKDKILNTIFWNEILDIKQTYHMMTRSIELIKHNEDKIVLNANNKIVSRILEICPSEDLSNKLKQIRFIL